MSMKVAVLIGAGALLITGCGGALESAAPQLSASEQALLWACTGANTWTRYWYSDSSQTNEVGREDCYCDGSVMKYGTTSGYYAQVAGTTCGGGGGGGGSGGCLGALASPHLAVLPNYPPPICE